MNYDQFKEFVRKTKAFCLTHEEFMEKFDDNFNLYSCVWGPLCGYHQKTSTY